MQDGTFPTPGNAEDTADRPGNAFAADCPTRQLLDRIGDKWSVLLLLLLGRGDRRFNALRREIGGVSQKMLSQTLRSLERDGLVTRTVDPAPPVAVTYAITPLARGLLSGLQQMIDWAETQMPAVVEAQQRFDGRRDVT